MVHLLIKKENDEDNKANLKLEILRRSNYIKPKCAKNNKHRKTRSLEQNLNVKIQGVSCDRQFDCLQDEYKIKLLKFNQTMTSKCSEWKKNPNIFSYNKEKLISKFSKDKNFLTLNNSKRNYYNSLKHTSSHEVTPKKRINENLVLNNIEPLSIKHDKRRSVLPQIHTVRQNMKSIKDLCIVNRLRPVNFPKKSARKL